MIRLKIRDKITGVLVIYFLVALVAIGSTLMASWRLEGGAAAINDAGRERMRSYRIAYLLEQQIVAPSAELHRDIQYEMVLFENTLNDLAHGNPSRPLFLPKEDDVHSKMAQLSRSWYADVKPQIGKILNSSNILEQQVELKSYRPMLEHYVADINDLVTLVEHSNHSATLLLRSFQIFLMILALLGTVLLVYLFSQMVVRPVTQLHDGIKRMTTADFSVRLPITSQDELGELAAGFNHMADELKDLYMTLERRVEEKTRSIEAKNSELATLDIEMAISEERNHLAQELHDSIAQSLAFLNIQVQLLQEDFQNGHNADAVKGLAKIREGVQESYDDVRQLLMHFRTRITGTDLPTAIRSALDKFEEKTGIKTSFNIAGEVPLLQEGQVLQIMHIVQESLSNARKHATASQINVELVCAEECVINIHDNGIGFDVTHEVGDDHVGLRIMRERAQRIGAELFFKSSPNKGTHICLILPK